MPKQEYEYRCFKKEEINIKIRKKTLYFVGLATLTFILFWVFSYVSIGRIHINRKMGDYLATKGNIEGEVTSVEVKHSFLGRLLSYNEWVIWVRYNDEPKAIYFYTYKNGNISPTGVSGIPEGKTYKHGDPFPVEWN